MHRKIQAVPIQGEKVTTASEMARVEKKSIEEGAGNASKYMENAAKGISHYIRYFLNEHSMHCPIYLLCGKGNNGGDAYATGEILLGLEFEVLAFQLDQLEGASELCRHHAKRFLDKGGKIVTVKEAKDVVIPPNGLVLDGIFGTGFRGKTEDLIYQVIEKINHLSNPVFSIDIPSGIPGDTGIVEGNAIIADVTMYLGSMKVGHLYNDGFEYVGDLVSVDFGLSEKYVKEMKPFGYLVNPEIMHYNLPFHRRTSNKYEVGELVIIGGSPGMPGAPLLASHAALRSGAGLVRLYHLAGMESELAAGMLEVIRTPFNPKDLAPIFEEIKRAKALLVGPGIGRNPFISEMLEKIYAEAKLPLVIDADALFFLKTPPKGAILTPHRGELLHILQMGKSTTSLELMKKAEEYVEKHGVTIVFKGAPTTIISPEKEKIIIPFGNEGMASGGMGDALAGIIASLLAQGKSPFEGAVLGVTLHAHAAELAMREVSARSLVVSDLINALPLLFLKEGR